MLMRKVPKGRSPSTPNSGRTNHLLVSTVTGVAPFVSYVRTLYKDFKEGKFSGEQKFFCSMAPAAPGNSVTSTNCGNLPPSSLAKVCPHGQPSLGRPEVDRGNRPGR